MCCQCFKIILRLFLLAVGLTPLQLWAGSDDGSHRAFSQEACVLEDQVFGQINTIGLKLLLNKNVPLILVDGRSAEAYQKNHIPGAVNLTYKATDQEIAQVLPDHNALLVVYCSNSACPKAGMLLERLKVLEYTSLIHYPYGIQSWEHSGFPLQAGSAGP